MIQQKLLVVLGPTAVGKTSLSLSLAETLAAEILSADSMQVYRGMDIGTAKATPEEQRRVVHHLLDIVDPDQPFNVADYVALAEDVLRDLMTQGTVPLITGGTGLYIDALLKGFLFPDTSADEGIRAQLQFEGERDPLNLYRRLEKVDPLSAKKLHPNDLRRVIRALEVYMRTGEPISTLQRKQEECQRPYRPLYIGLFRERQELYERVNLRVDQMIAEGLVEEVERLLKAYPQQPTALQALGYKEIASYLRGKSTLDEATERLKRDTRRYAKRQISWFKRNKDIHWFNRSEVSDDELIEAVSSLWTTFVEEPS